jgi:putative PEP-CTERM system TPR-repeat lipoprotein
LRARQLDKALAATERLAAKPGMKSIALHLQGRVQLERNDVPRAREAFEASLKHQPTYFPAASALAALDLQENKPDAARKRFETVLEAAPSNLDARMALVGLRANAGAGKDELAQALQTAIKFNTTAPQPRIALIKLELDRNQAKAAEAAAMDALAAIPDNADLIDLLGQSQLRLGEYSQARANFGKLTNLLPDAVLPLLRLAQVDLAENQPQAAIVNIRKALPLDPSSLLLRNLLAAAQIAAGKPQDALATARLMQGEAKNAATGWMLEGDVQVTLKKWKAAAEAYRHSIEREETTEAAIKLRTALVGARGDNVAWERSWLAKHPGDSGFMSHLAGAELDAEHFDAAEQLYRRVVEIDAKNAVAWNNLAWLAGRAKRPEALQYVQTARQLLPKEALFVDTEADIYAMRGDLAKAVATQEQAVAMAPGKPILRLRLATLYLQVDKKAQAKKELTGLAELGDKFPKAAEVKALLAKL